MISLKDWITLQWHALSPPRIFYSQATWKIDLHLGHARYILHLSSVVQTWEYIQSRGKSEMQGKKQTTKKTIQWLSTALKWITMRESTQMVNTELCKAI